MNVINPGRWAAPQARCCLWMALLCALAAPVGAQPLQLVTEEEVAREMAAPAPAVTAKVAPRPDAPTIKVLAPLLGNDPLANPLSIQLVFAAAADAEIDPASFRAQYGTLRIDLTERIAGRVAVEKSGLRVDNVVIPRGSHRLLLRIADTKARVGEAEIRFSVQ